MPRNVYFSQAVRSEQNLYEDLVIESLKIFGQDVYYIPRNLVERDNILGEDRASSFEDAYLIEAYIDNQDGFEGAGDLYQKFGLEIRDEANFIISKRQWERIVGLYNNYSTSGLLCQAFHVLLHLHFNNLSVLIHISFFKH